MSQDSVFRILGNKLYQRAFPIYWPVYAAYKACADHAERQLVRQILVPGAVALDVGANIGIYSRFLARCVGPAGAVHCFEPAPENFKHLVAAACGFRNMHVVQAAVGERSGKSELYLSDTLNVDHRTYQTDNSARRVLQTEMVALDDYFKSGQRVDFIKMDVQGYEVHALRGANRILGENPAATLLLELWPYGLKQAGTNWIELIDVLRSKNLTISEVTRNGLLPVRPSLINEDPAFYISLFASQH